MLNQTYQEPFLAVVIDPTRTVSAGKVEIGAFRTYPQGHKPPDEPPSEYQTIPLNKIEDFGVHYKQVREHLLWITGDWYPGDKVGLNVSFVAMVKSHSK